MDEQTKRRVPRPIIEALEASTKDIAEGNLQDARNVQTEAQRMLVNYERTISTVRKPASEKATRRIRPA